MLRAINHRGAHRHEAEERNSPQHLVRPNLVIHDVCFPIVNLTLAAARAIAAAVQVPPIYQRLRRGKPLGRKNLFASHSSR